MPAVGCLVAAINSSTIVLTPTSSSTDSTRLEAPSSSYEQTERLKIDQETRITMVLRKERSTFKEIFTSVMLNFGKTHEPLKVAKT